jgi:uncharacterized membrane protein YeaQ/YmgE (transglycosylase-associated protein family)
MGVLAWMVTGLIAGMLARAVIGAPRRGCLYTMLIGVVGGLIGGAIFNAAGDEGISDFGIRSTFVAFVGACLLLFLFQLLDRRP